MVARSGSRLRLAMASRGRIRALFRSKITSEGRLSRMVSSNLSAERSKRTSACSDLAAVEIRIENIRSSMAQTIIGFRAQDSGFRDQGFRIADDSRGSGRCPFLQEWLRGGLRAHA